MLSSLPTVSSNKLAWLFMASALQVASKHWLHALSLSHCSPVDLMTNSDSAFPDIEKLKQQIAPHLIKRALDWERSDVNHHLVSYSSNSYPDSLKHLDSPPLILFVVGNVGLLKNKQIAVVGSRRASEQGKKIAEDFAQRLSINGLTITSGLAMGIDSAAHRGGLEGQGNTIAVMGTGPDKVYPAKNIALFARIKTKGGAVVSEFFPGVGPKPWHFPRRNRIIAAMCVGTLVVEAKIKSGTLITANLAADLGKEVFAVPGNIFHAYAQGCHWLIQQGAKLVTSTDDIFEEFAIVPQQLELTQTGENEKSEVNSLATDKLLASVDYDITAIDVIAQRTAITVDKAMASLLEYELRGLVAAVPGGYVKLRGK